MNKKILLNLWKTSLLFLFLIINVEKTTAQIKTIKIKSEHYTDTSISKILTDVQWKYGYKVAVDPSLIPDKKMSLWLEDVTLREFLDLIIGQNNLPLVVVMENANAAKIQIRETEKISNADRPSDFKPTRSNFSISGVLKDVNTGESLPFATVGVKGQINLYTQTNVDGYFTLQNVPNDTLVLEATYVGYLVKKFRLEPSFNFSKLLIELQEEPLNLGEVVVTAEKTEMVQANQIVGMIKMTPKNIAKLPNIGEKDPFRAFQLMPGVSASNENSSGLYVRGGTPDQTLVLYDGFTVYNVDHLFGFFSAFNYNAIKDIQLYKGGFDARFGGRISAVAEITGKEGNTKKPNAGLDLSLLSTNAYFESPLGKKMTVLVAARRSYKGPLYTKIFDKFTAQSDNTQQTQAAQGPGAGRGGNTLQTTTKANSYFYDLNSKITYKPTSKDIISWSIFNGTDNMDNSTTASFANFGRFQNAGIGVGTTTNDIRLWGNTGSSLRWSRNWNSKLYSNTLVSFSNYYSERDNSQNQSITRGDSTFTTRIGRFETNDLKDYSFKTDWEYKLNSNNQIEFGGMSTYNHIKFNYTQNDTTTVLNRDDSGIISSVYAQDRFKTSNGKLELIPGIRMSSFSVTNKIYFEPRFTFNYLINDKLKLKGAAGIYNQFIKQINREDITQGNRNFWVLADGNNLPVTHSKHLILGAAYEKANYLFDVEFYQKQNSGITEYTLRFVPQFNAPGTGGPGGPGGGNQGLAVAETFFNGTETIRGMDILVQKKFGKYTGWLAYTLAEAVRSVAAFSDKPYYSDQDVRQQFKAVGTYSVKNWDIAATWIYSTGRPYTSIIGAYNLTLLDGTTKTFTNPSDKNANRFIPYHRMDVSATRNFKYGSLGLSIFNVYNRSNIWYKRYEIVQENGVSALHTTNVTYLGITPNLTLSLRLK